MLNVLRTCKSTDSLSMLQTAMVAKLDAKAEQAAIKGVPLDDEIVDDSDSESGDISPSSAKEPQMHAASGPGAAKGPAQKRARKKLEGVWESACKLPGSTGPQSSQLIQVSTGSSM